MYKAIDSVSRTFLHNWENIWSAVATGDADRLKRAINHQARQVSKQAGTKTAAEVERIARVIEVEKRNASENLSRIIQATTFY